MTLRPTTFWLIGGFLLGLGAPLGSLIVRLPVRLEHGWTSALAQEWSAGQYYYVYMTVGTTIAFALFGYFLGKRNEHLGELSATDGLTGLSNHRTLQGLLTHEIQRVQRYHTPLTCMMIDIDDFKKVNDEHGHLFGDRVLATTARMIQSGIRQTDFAGRYGGEEFLVIMPQTNAAAALPVAERVLKEVGRRTYRMESGQAHVTLSIGLATYPDPDQGVKSKSALLSAADQALYQAKLAGKNQIVRWRS